MKTFLTITHRLRRFTALLVTFTLLHGGLSAFAATVSWTGAGGDGFWSNRRPSPGPVRAAMASGAIR